MTFGTVAILGPGLIGGSLALALAKEGLAERIVVYARSDASFPQIHEKLPEAVLTTDVEVAVRGADIVILCVPVETMAALVKRFVSMLKPTALVTDVGSVKGSIDRELSKILAQKAHWIGSHPMAGSEQAGFSAARANLFEGAAVIITPTEETSPTITECASQFWSSLGGRVVRIDPHAHDIAVAEISHIPHLLAAFLVGKITEEGRGIAGGGFRDTTRVASGSPELWTEILWSNREAVALHLRSWKTWLADLEKEIFQSKEPSQAKSELRKILKDAQVIRSQMIIENPIFSKSP